MSCHKRTIKKKFCKNSKFASELESKANLEMQIMCEIVHFYYFNFDITLSTLWGILYIVHIRNTLYCNLKMFSFLSRNYLWFQNKVYNYSFNT